MKKQSKQTKEAQKTQKKQEHLEANIPKSNNAKKEQTRDI